MKNLNRNLLLMKHHKWVSTVLFSPFRIFRTRDIITYSTKENRLHLLFTRNHTFHRFFNCIRRHNIIHNGVKFMSKYLGNSIRCPNWESSFIINCNELFQPTFSRWFTLEVHLFWNQSPTWSRSNKNLTWISNVFFTQFFLNSIIKFDEKKVTEFVSSWAPSLSRDFRLFCGVELISFDLSLDPILLLAETFKKKTLMFLLED